MFFNAGTNRLDLEGFFEIQSSQGLFGEIWVMQLDRDAETAAEVNSTFGWMKEVLPNMILGGGFSNYANQNLNEIFMGGNISLITGVAFFGLNNSPANFIGIIDLNFGPLKKIPIDLSMMAVRENSGSDLFFIMKKTTKKGITVGYTFSRERFESEETRTFTKQGHKKSWTVPIQEDGFFNKVYFGFVF
ncbi:MAG: hypothetical protein HOE56_09225 [Candidatus Marinimicrobia bacterium]|nr:hypothetical protein [Candidatus Neomarinimicrobiota bacterium]